MNSGHGQAAVDSKGVAFEFMLHSFQRALETLVPPSPALAIPFRLRSHIYRIRLVGPKVKTAAEALLLEKDSFGDDDRVGAGQHERTGPPAGGRSSFQNEIVRTAIGDPAGGSEGDGVGQGRGQIIVGEREEGRAKIDQAIGPGRRVGRTDERRV